MLHSDCDGEWSVAECARLRGELATIAVEARRRPPLPLDGWKASAAEDAGLVPRSAYESFIDVDGVPLIARLSGLVDLAIERRLSILFQ